ncbi:hypothetical protein [Microvirga puerhi]|uniref:Uncharacterized protein n=1 Tax=Microvirga puerhi TaxID=2876078 RepID=A0ABS7VLS9_9HYPH|nr:hypothetical protein [Microvirga puerhi]MBZ6075908.1 hypothetical protein [Microvirga puerhi]
MNVARYRSPAKLVLGIVASVAAASAMAAEPDLSGYQGAWLAGGPDCADVYSLGAKSASFKKPVDIFAPAFIISGNRLRTPMATCRITSVKQSEDRQLLGLHCTNAVASNDVTVLMSPTADGSLRRYFNNHDTIGTTYLRCPR